MQYKNFLAAHKVAFALLGALETLMIMFWWLGFDSQTSFKYLSMLAHYYCLQIPILNHTLHPKCMILSVIFMGSSILPDWKCFWHDPRYSSKFLPSKQLIILSVDFLWSFDAIQCRPKHRVTTNTPYWDQNWLRGSVVRHICRWTYLHPSITVWQKCKGNHDFAH